MKIRIVFIALLVVASVFTALSPARAQDALRVTLLVNGTLGDKSFFDSANRGLKQAEADFGIVLKVIETGEDQTKWEPALVDAMSDVDNYDLLIAGTFEMARAMTENADQYPDKKFVMFDTAVDYTACKCANVYSVEYAQNEGSYLAGVYVGAMIKDGKLEGLSGKPIIGAVGGLDIPVINDFIVGYEQGAKSVLPDVQLLKQYIAGDKPFFDPAKGKEIALSMYDQGANFVFGIAGGSGQGVIEAAKERNRYMIGVDSDQATVIADTDPEGAARILTSMMKNVDASLYRAIKLEKEGTLAYGAREVIGLAEGAVGLAVNDIYNKATPDSVKALIEQAQKDIIDCKIIVATAYEVPTGKCAQAAEATPSK